MQKLKHSRLLPIVGLLLGMVVWLANNGNPPTGKTAAPFDGNCNDCHSGNTYNGTVELTGFPATAEPGILYDINLKMTATAGSPSKGGFQLVVVDANDNSCGTLSTVNGQTGIESFGGRTYIEHRSGKVFAGGMVNWDFRWKAPNSVPGNTVKVYVIGNFCNGNGGTGGDNPIWDNISFGFSGPPPLVASISGTTDPLCFGANTGTATADATGGTPPYTYAWPGGQTTQTAINLTAGSYIVTVTATGGGGTATAVATITQPTAVTLTTSVSGTVSCLGNATATATAGGGTPGYTFLWSDGQTDNVATFDTPGSYTVTATDANGCTKIASVNITGNTTPPIAVAGPQGELSCIVLQTQLNGAGSSVGPNITYAWTTTNGSIVSGQTTLTPTVNQCGVYTLTVTNNTNGCTASASAQVICTATAPNASALGGTLTCINTNVTLSGSSTTPGVIFIWSGPGITSGNQNEQNPTVDQAGTYILTVTNPENGCTKTASAIVTTNTTAPTATATVSGQLTCANTSVQLNLSSNITNALYSWTGPNGFTSNVANPTVTASGEYMGMVTDPVNGCQGFGAVIVVQNIAPPTAFAGAIGQLTCDNDTVIILGNSNLAPDVTYSWVGPNFNSTLPNAEVAAPGTYVLTVMGNANGCTSTAVATVIQNIEVPFDSIVKPGNLNCNNASIQLNATPSSQGPSFTYLWTAKEGGHIVSGDTTLTPVVDTTGKYFLIITNIENGCTSLDSVVVNQSATVTAAITASVSVSCNGGTNGSATAAGGGGNGTYTYLWSNGDVVATATGLSAGTYIVSVTDGEGCTASVSVTITQPEVLVANASATGETALGANDGTATANPTGGTAPYVYLWSTNAITQTITNLAPGSVSVSITDANGCTTVQTVTVNAFGCNLVASAASTNASCNGSNDGLASVNLTGAINPVTYAWSNGASTQSVNNLAPGIYTVNVVDGSNCPAALSISISEPPVLAANASATNVTTLGATDGTATATPTGGTSPYTYVWSTNATTQSISGLAPGAYTVVVTDANACSSSQVVTVSAFNCALSASGSGAQVSCFGGNDGQATVTISGGTLPYTYLWNNGETTQTIINLAAGTYTASATDAAGCSVSQNVTVSEPPVLNLNVISVINVLCPDDNTGQVNLGVSGGVAPYTFSWPGGNTSNFGVGNYVVSVTDANNCVDTAPFSIVATDNLGPTMTCPADIQICGGNLVSYGTPSVSDNCGVEAPPTVISGPPSGSAFSEGVTVITYQATDISGNSTTCSFAIVVNVVPDILIDNVVNDMNGQGLGVISVTPVGAGTFTYVWTKNGQPFANTEDLSGLTAGSYSLVITDENSCTSALAPIVITNTVGTSEPGQIGSVKLWPNPAHDAIQLEIIDLDVIAASIVDLRGRLVQNLQASTLSAGIDVQQLPAGMYALKLSTANGRVLSLKFIIN